MSPSVRFAEEAMQSEENGDLTQTEASSANATVRCPDCDLCDGSGR